MGCAAKAIGGMTLDPQIARYLSGLASANAPEASTPEEWRAGTREYFKAARPAEILSVETTVELEVPADDGFRIPARYYRPSDAARTVILYCHGGGWTTGDVDTHDEIARALARDSGCGVLSLGYRLAPESPFPRPLLDCVAAWEWLRDSPPPGIGQPRRVALAGDSAGGNLCAALSLVLRDAGAPVPVAQLLAYPSLDLTLATSARSLEQLGRGYQLTTRQIHQLIGYYTPNAQDRNDGLASPIRVDSHAGLPTTMIVTAGFDPLRDDGDTYAQLLFETGAVVCQLRFGSLIHGFFDIAPIIPAAMAARSRVFRHFGLLIRDSALGV